MVTIPNEWRPRPHQLNLYDNFGHGKKFKRASIVWHRRAGKDSTALNLTARDMFKRVGTYWHLFPQQNQARKAIWNGVDRNGRRILDQFLPPEVRVNTTDDQMFARLANGSTWQLAGSDMYDSLVGSNPVGVVFSEWALSNPAAWDFIRPILAENGGWALFITTPRGRNHAYTTHSMALNNPSWLAETLTVDDTGVITAEDVQAERDAGMSESRVQQEFYCDFSAEVDDAFIQPDDVREAMTRPPYAEIGDELVMGVDVARFGDDRTCIWTRRGRDARSIKPIIMKGADTMAVAARVMAEIDLLRPDGVFIDEGGVGGGVIDRCRQMGYSVVGVNFGSKADRHIEGVPKSKNKRAQMWASMREWLRSGGAIPDDRTLEMDLTGPLYSFDVNNAVELEKKSDMKKRGVPSPDMADALALTFAYPVVPRSMKQVKEARQVENYSPIWGA